MDDINNIVPEILGGNTGRYARIVDQYERMVRAIVAAMIPDRNRVPDITQEVFVTAYRRLSTYRMDASFPAWLSTIARNTARNERRRWYHRQNMKEQYHAEIEKRIEEDIDAMASTLHGDVLGNLTQCVEELPQKLKLAVESFYFKAHSVKETAAGLNMTEGALRVTLHRARHALAGCLKKKGGFASV